MIRRRHPSATQSTTRLAAFTDGVFAIAATLLVLNLTTASFGEVHSDAQLWSALAGEWLLFFTFALSFVLLCLLWMTHTRQFERISRVDTTLMWLNNFRLLFIVLVPFATDLTTEYSDYYAGRLAMAVTFFFAVLCSWLQWQWAVHHREQILPDLTDAHARAVGRGNLSALLIIGVIVVLAPFVGSWAFLLFLLDGPLTKLLRGADD